MHEQEEREKINSYLKIPPENMPFNLLEALR